MKLSINHFIWLQTTPLVNTCYKSSNIIKRATQFVEFHRNPWKRMINDKIPYIFFLKPMNNHINLISLKFTKFLNIRQNSPKSRHHAWIHCNCWKLTHLWKSCYKFSNIIKWAKFLSFSPKHHTLQRQPLKSMIKYQITKYDLNPFHLKNPTTNCQISWNEENHFI